MIPKKKVGSLVIALLSFGFYLEFIMEQKDPKTGELEGVSYDFNICEAVATWEQVGSPYDL